MKEIYIYANFWTAVSFPSPLRTVKIIYALVSVRFAFILSPSTFSGYRTPNKYHRRRLFFFTINNSFLFFRFHLVPKYRIKTHDDSTNASNFKYVLCDLKKKKKSLSSPDQSVFRYLSLKTCCIMWIIRDRRNES